MQNSYATDVEAFNLRRTGRSFGAIARQLGYESAPDATHAFFRALSASEPAEQQLVRDEEHGRLTQLAEHVRADASLDETTRSRRLAVVDRLRQRVDAACDATQEVAEPSS